MDTELARRQLAELVEQARADFDNDHDVDVYGGPVRLRGAPALAAVAVADDERRVYVWLPAANAWRERADLDPDEIEGLISWGQARHTRRED